MIRATNERITEMGERMAAMEKAVRTLEKVTPQQAGRINQAIRDRAAVICEEYRMGTAQPETEVGRGRYVVTSGFKADPEKVNALATAIRRDVRKMAGVKATREIARCDYDAMIAYVIDWEDYETVQKIRKGMK